MKSYKRSKRVNGNSREIRQSMVWRRLSAVVVFVLLATMLLAKTLDMQILRSEFFEQQGDARQLRTVSIAAHRGDIVDRNGDPFAVSVPVNSIWLNPKVAKYHLDELAGVASLLSLDVISLKKKIKDNGHREFLYLKRHASPELADKVMALKVPGVSLQNEYRRYYPSGEVAAHVVGFSDIDDNG
ncbi:MAG: penicillin-binding protein 2, partial [Gammaproteobacteria bacterium]|nr:penicillin-binding protein 2 [Gammaproteobacteria bacterium]